MEAEIGNFIPDTVLSVGGLTAYIQDLLEEDDRLHQVWLVGEVSSANQHRSGVFFTLQDVDGKAAISCVIWNHQADKLAHLPVPGEQLLVLGSIRLYPPRGQYQFTVWYALPAGEGLQAMQYRRLKNRLAAEGMFDVERKRSLPAHPQVIAVVTSPQAAAWGDIQKTLRGRYPGLHVLFSPATVQGEQAPDSIVSAIDRVQQDGRAEVLILARGGGAVEELACFNDERVVRAIATCTIPVITGIGHQRDESLADLVADVCAHTPTAAAETAVPELAELYAEHQARIIDLQAAARQHLAAAQNRLQLLQNRCRQLRLDRQVRQEMQAIAALRQNLVRATKQRLEKEIQQCDFLGQKLATIDPKVVLQRGYAVVRTENGAIARSTADLSLGQELNIQLGQGEIKVEITEILPIITTRLDSL
jgi:exodeoxyribonuclease VII large subunit